MKSQLFYSVACLAVATVVAAPAKGATLSAGYVMGSGSQLLTANGGSGTTLFADAATLGGSDVNGTGASFFSVLLDGSSFWNVGEAVSITGFALPLVDAATDDGTFTFDIRQGAGGSGASGTAGLASLGTAEATYTSGGGTSAYYVNFDTPVTFVADSNSTSIVINWTSTATMRFKKRTEPTGGALPQVNYANGNFVGGDDTVSVSVAGSVVPEPASMALALCCLLGMAAGRRR
ncbi:hypothetical protein [Bythopirellula polymerisocia]|uniref:PEP-CTERM protein-sorting domain-containing protein n=1 Tax=Bythopirellula polymerisocia TaxID=2528003 RepID=A0A5C6CHG3_9BACT|nr:hypothetical protein [Bythopirellula polymerisocia]TWU22711.1 hypothetical protein Pla144_41720 [Bythopirellula polymerisocia]